MVHNTEDWKDPGEIPSQGNTKAGGDEISDTDRRNLGLPPARRCPAGGGLGGDEDLHIHMPECGHAVHCNMTYY